MQEGLPTSPQSSPGTSVPPVTLLPSSPPPLHSSGWILLLIPLPDPGSPPLSLAASPPSPRHVFSKPEVPLWLFLLSDLHWLPTARPCRLLSQSRTCCPLSCASFSITRGGFAYRGQLTCPRIPAPCFSSLAFPPGSSAGSLLPLLHVLKSCSP